MRAALSPVQWRLILNWWLQELGLHSVTARITALQHPLWMLPIRQ